MSLKADINNNNKNKNNISNNANSDIQKELAKKDSIDISEQETQDFDDLTQNIDLANSVRNFNHKWFLLLLLKRTLLSLLVVVTYKKVFEQILSLLIFQFLFAVLNLIYNPYTKFYMRIHSKITEVSMVFVYMFALVLNSQQSYQNAQLSIARLVIYVTFIVFLFHIIIAFYYFVQEFPTVNQKIEAWINKLKTSNKAVKVQPISLKNKIFQKFTKENFISDNSQELKNNKKQNQFQDQKIIYETQNFGEDSETLAKHNESEQSQEIMNFDNNHLQPQIRRIINRNQMEHFNYSQQQIENQSPIYNNDQSITNLQSGFNTGVLKQPTHQPINQEVSLQQMHSYNQFAQQTLNTDYQLNLEEINELKRQQIQQEDKDQEKNQKELDQVKELEEENNNNNNYRNTNIQQQNKLQLPIRQARRSQSKVKNYGGLFQALQINEKQDTQ